MADFSNQKGILEYYQELLEQYEQDHETDYHVRYRIKRCLIEAVERGIDSAAGLDIVLALAIYRARFGASSVIAGVGQMEDSVEIDPELRIRSETAIWIVKYSSAIGIHTAGDISLLLATLNALWDGLAVKPLTA